MTPQPRSRQFLVSTIAQLVGGREQAAVLANVSKDVFDKACAERDLTVGAVVSLISNAGKTKGSDALDDIVNELARHFVPPRRRLIFEDLIDEYERQIEHSKSFLQALQNGGRLKPTVVTENCTQCDGPVEYIRICPACSRARR